MLNQDTLWRLFAWALPAAILASAISQRSPASTYAPDYHWVFLLRSARSMRSAAFAAAARHLHWGVLNVALEYLGLAVTLWVLLQGLSLDPGATVVPVELTLIFGFAHSWVLSRIRQLHVNRAAALPPSADIENVVVHYSKQSLKLLWLAKCAAGKRFLAGLETEVETHARQQLEFLRNCAFAYAPPDLLERALAETAKVFAGAVRFSLLLRLGKQYHQRRLARVYDSAAHDEEWLHLTILALEPVLGSAGLAQAVMSKGKELYPQLRVGGTRPSAATSAANRMRSIAGAAVGVAAVLLLMLFFNVGQSSSAPGTHSAIAELEEATSVAAVCEWCKRHGAPERLGVKLRDKTIDKEMLREVVTHWPGRDADFIEAVYRLLLKWVLK